MNKYDDVQKPEHYNHGELEVIEIMRDQLPEMPLNPYQGYLLGNVIKYVLRHPYKKNAIQDLEKAKWYLDHLVESEKGIKPAMKDIEAEKVNKDTKDTESANDYTKVSKNEIAKYEMSQLLDNPSIEKFVEGPSLISEDFMIDVMTSSDDFLDNLDQYPIRDVINLDKLVEGLSHLVLDEVTPSKLFELVASKLGSDIAVYFDKEKIGVSVKVWKKVLNQFELDILHIVGHCWTDINVVEYYQVKSREDIWKALSELDDRWKKDFWEFDMEGKGNDTSYTDVDSAVKKFNLAYEESGTDDSTSESDKESLSSATLEGLKEVASILSSPKLETKDKLSKLLGLGTEMFNSDSNEEDTDDSEDDDLESLYAPGVIEEVKKSLESEDSEGSFQIEFDKEYIESLLKAGYPLSDIIKDAQAEISQVGTGTNRSNFIIHKLNPVIKDNLTEKFGDEYNG